MEYPNLEQLLLSNNFTLLKVICTVTMPSEALADIAGVIISLIYFYQSNSLVLLRHLIRMKHNAMSNPSLIVVNESKDINNLLRDNRF